jgi:hypothetical protein
VSGVESKGAVRRVGGYRGFGEGSKGRAWGCVERLR